MSRTYRWKFGGTALAIAMMVWSGCETSLLISPPSDPEYVVPGPGDILIPIYDGNQSGEVGLAGAFISLYRDSSSILIFKGTDTTDADGVGRFLSSIVNHYQPEKYLISVRKAGYFSATVYAIISGAANIIPEIRLQLSDITVLDDYKSITVVAGQVTELSTLPGTTTSGTITFGANSLTTTTDVGIASLTGTQIPQVPEGQVALNVIAISLDGALADSAELSLELPFDLPAEYAGLTIPVMRYDESLGVWVPLTESGTVDSNGVVTVSDVDLFGQLSLFAAMAEESDFVPDVTDGFTRQNFGAEGGVITEFWTPEFSEVEDYPPKTETWLESTLEGILGFEFNVVQKVTLVRP